MGERKDLRDLLRDTDFTQKRIIDDLASSEIEPFPTERDLGRDIRRSEGGDFIKNFFVALLLVAIVVGSFWISFLLGKRVLIPPVKNLPTFEAPAMGGKPEEAPKTVSKSELESASPVEQQEELTVPEKEIKPAAVPEPRPAAKVAVYRYKVIVGTYVAAADARRVASLLKTNGFKWYIKKTAEGYRVQAGAFTGRELAAPLINKLRARGFSPSIIVE